MMKSFKNTTIFFLLLTSTFALAQQTKFTGTWTQTNKTSISGKDYANGLPTKISITQNGEQLSLDRTSITKANGEDSTENQKLVIDGKPKIQTGKISKRTFSVLAVEHPNHSGFKETTQISAAEHPDQKNFEIVEDWTLSVDGKTLTITKTFTNFLDPEDKWAMSGTYQKQ